LQKRSFDPGLASIPEECMMIIFRAGVAELADAPDSKSGIL
jgi:hypothetical protein